jgi:hypothetical protein
MQECLNSLELDIYDLAKVVFVQRVENHYFVDTVEKLGPEVGVQDFGNLGAFDL